MQWPTKPDPPKPNYGVSRIVEVFAIFPIKCQDGVTRWLEWVWKRQVYACMPDEWVDTAYAAKGNEHW
jgi:hypothetical protein